MTFQPKDPHFADRVRASFARQRMMQTLGVEITRIGPGEIELAMPYEAAFTQQDSACGYAAFSLMPADAAVLTVEFKTNLLAPAKGERFLFRAHVVKPGRTLTVCDGQAFAIENGADERLVATMNGTLMALFDRPNIGQ
jgi:acyl-coenzyme A thioesterase PaaI-like protein